jgi:aspartate 1-decarboxylase
MLQMLKAKIQSVVVTESHINYPGSISLPEELLKASGIKPFELVHVNNRTSGKRIVTYAVKSREQGYVSVNGAASHFFRKGDSVHVLAFAYLSETEAETFQPILVTADTENKLLVVRAYQF